MSNGEPPRPERAPVALPMLFGALVFAPMLRNGFWRDDYGWISRAMSALQDPGAFFALSKTDFRPLPGLSFMLNFLLSDLHPLGYYAFNLAVHLGVIALFVTLVYQVTGRDRDIALVAGLLFAGGFGHYGEAVIWISGRTGLLADLFVLAAMLAYWRALETGRASRSVLAMLFFLLALLSKESAVVALPLMIVLDWMRGGPPLRSFSWSFARRYAPHFALLLGYLVFQFAVIRQGSSIVGSEYRPGVHVLPNLFEYMARFFLPVTPTSMIVGVPPSMALALQVAQWFFMVAAPIAALWVLFGRTPRAAKLGVVWVVITIAPFLLLTFRTSTRYLYGPSMGLALCVAAFAVPLVRRAGEGAGRRTPFWRVAFFAVLLLEAAVVNVVIHQRYREQMSQDPTPLQNLRREAETRFH